MLKRTNTGRRSTALNGESIMKSGSIVTGSTVNDTASLTVNAGSHAARAVHGMLNKSRHGIEAGQDIDSENENFEIAADTKNTSSFSKSNQYFRWAVIKKTQPLIAAATGTTEVTSSSFLLTTPITKEVS